MRRRGVRFLVGGDVFAQTSNLEVFGIHVDDSFSTRAPMDNRINAAQAVWFGNHGWFRCRLAPEGGRCLLRCGRGARGWKGKWLRSAIPHALPRGSPFARVGFGGHPHRPGHRPSGRFPVALAARLHSHPRLSHVVHAPHTNLCAAIAHWRPPVSWRQFLAGPPRRRHNRTNWHRDPEDCELLPSFGRAGQTGPRTPLAKGPEGFPARL